LEILQRIFSPEAFLEVVRLTLNRPVSIPRWWGRRQLDPLIEFVQELLYLNLSPALRQTVKRQVTVR
jgi:hypothetical protein